MNVEEAKQHYAELANAINPILNSTLEIEEQIELSDPVEIEEYLIELMATWFWQAVRFGVAGTSFLPFTEPERLAEVRAEIKEVFDAANKVKRALLKDNPDKSFEAILELITRSTLLVFACGFSPVELVDKLKEFAEQNDKNQQAKRYGATY